MNDREIAELLYRTANAIASAANVKDCPLGRGDLIRYKGGRWKITEVGGWAWCCTEWIAKMKNVKKNGHLGQCQASIMRHDMERVEILCDGVTRREEPQ